MKPLGVQHAGGDRFYVTVYSEPFRDIFKQLCRRGYALVSPPSLCQRLGYDMRFLRQSGHMYIGHDRSKNMSVAALTDGIEVKECDGDGEDVERFVFEYTE